MKNRRKLIAAEKTFMRSAAALLPLICDEMIEAVGTETQGRKEQDFNEISGQLVDSLQRLNGWMS